MHISENLATKNKHKPVIVIRMGARGQTLTWEGQTFIFTNGDADTLTQLAVNICKITGIT